MATLTRTLSRPTGRDDAPVIVLEGVFWETYETLRDAEANGHVRMTYDDGRLELMSPSFRHENDAGRLADMVRVLTMELRLPCLGARSTTLRRRGKGRLKGKGKEPDSCFYLANEPRMRGKDAYDPAVDPPPDLAIEVEVSHRSESALRVYAKLGVPEVWRYDGRSLWIGRLRDNGTYAACDHSPGLPMLTPGVVVKWMKRLDEAGESEGLIEFQEWVRKELVPRYRARKK
jgi:Uma2 family endonuclease